MHNFFIIIGSLMLMIGWPTIFFIIASNIMKKKKIKKHIINFFVISIIGFLLICIGGYIYGQTDEYKEQLAKEEQEKNNNTQTESNTEETESIFESEIETINIVESETETNSKEKEETVTETEKVYTEAEYKSMCEELYYDDVFFGKDDLENKYVKLHLFLTSKQFFTADTILYSDSWEKYNLERNLFECSVLRENLDSYAGKGKIKLLFSKNFELDPNNYKTGEKIIVYAQVISWNNNTWDGYNSVVAIPRYIEKN